MTIQFKKNTSKSSILNCIRDDGSVTWVTMHPGIEAHDLAHYAVELTLGFQNAFYGMVAKGTNIPDFELPKDKRPTEVIPRNLSSEALVSEHLVNLLMTKAQYTNGFDIIPTLKTILDENHLPFPEQLNERQLDKIWGLFQKLLKQWENLTEGNVLELEFRL